MDEQSAPYWVYVLENPQGRFYVGYTDDRRRRVDEHNDAGRGYVTFTHKGGPWRLAWSEPHADRGSAVRRERQIKRMKSARWIREHLLNGRVPARRD